MYSPESKESDGGEKLVRKADIHIGKLFGFLTTIKTKVEKKKLF